MLLSFILGNKHNAPDDVKSLLQQKFVHWTDFVTVHTLCSAIVKSDEIEKNFSVDNT